MGFLAERRCGNEKLKKTLSCLAAAMMMVWGGASQAQTGDLVGDLLGKLEAPVAPALEAIALKATLYITTQRSSGRDSIGCHVIPMRTAAVDGVHVRRRTLLFIQETVGLRMPDGHIHDGYWYATDVGSAIVPGRIDLYTGKGFNSILPLLPLNLRTLTVRQVGHFAGCPSAKGAPEVADLAPQPQPVGSQAIKRAG